MGRLLRGWLTAILPPTPIERVRVASRQFILINPGGDPLGLKFEVLERLARHNTAPDGSGETQGVAFGPGFHVELPWVGDRDPVPQAAVTVVDEDAAWQVLARLLRLADWRLMDIESGQVFGEPSS